MIRIEAPHFVAGIVQGGLCAPIIGYMKGWTARQICRYASEKGWTWTLM